MLITTEQRTIANQLNKMETFSKLRPPDAVRIKVKLIEQLQNSDSSELAASIESNFSNQTTTSENTIQILDKKFKIIQTKKFCVDPLITSFEILTNLISQAFSIKQDFQLSYISRENHPTSNSHEFTTLFNDWDLDAAFSNSSQPYLSINAQIHEHNENKFYLNESGQKKPTYDEWDVISTNDSVLKNQTKLNETQSKKTSLNRSKTYNVMNLGPNRSLIALWSNSAADKAVSVFQRVLNGLSRSSSFNQANSSSSSRSNSIPNQNTQNQSNLNIFDLSHIEQSVKLKQPLGEAEYKNFLDSDGRVVQPQELRQRIFEGGCDPAKRKELWPILLDIFPNQSMTAKERADFIKLKSIEYDELKKTLWHNSNKSLLKNSAQIVSDGSFDSNNNTCGSDEANLCSLAHKIHKDVWRTDRNHKFFSGDSNSNVDAMFNILMTFSLSNESANAYSQGMSDLLSPLLFVLRDEPLAYLCFSSLIKRCISNFDVLSFTMTTKIKLLNSLILKYDPEFGNYLSQVGADQLLFVYRWLLIECKREFPFNDSLRALEVMWSTTQQNCQDLPKMQIARSNSNASSISLKLLRKFHRNAKNHYLNDDYMTTNDDEEFSDHYLETSSTSGGLKQNNNNEHGQSSACDICVAERSFAKLNTEEKENGNDLTCTSSEGEEEEEEEEDDDCYPTDTDLESINGFNYYNKFNSRRKERLRRLSLNSSFFSHKNKCESEPAKFVASSLNEKNDNFYLMELKEQQLEDKSALDRIKRKRRLRTRNTGSVLQFNNLIKKNQKSLSSNCVFNAILTDCEKRVSTNRSQANLKTASENEKCEMFYKKFKNKPLALPILMAKSTSSTVMSSSLQNARFSTSEAETITLANNLRNSLTNQRISAGLSEDMSAWSPLFYCEKNKKSTKFSAKIKTQKKIKKQKKILVKHNTNSIKLNQCSSPLAALATTTENEITKNLFKNIKKSLKRSHNRINKCFNNKKRLDSGIETTNTKQQSEKTSPKCSCSNSVFNSCSFERQKTGEQKPVKKAEVKVNHKKSTSSKSSTSAYVSAASVASSASSISSSCSTRFLNADQIKFSSNFPIVSTSIPIVRVHDLKSPLGKKSFDDEQEEDLIYSLSKLDNPFLLFMCFAMFLEHRDHIMASQMDSNDIACYFDKMTRKHNMKNVLNRARYLYTKLYLAKKNVFNYIQQLMDIQNSP